MSTKLLYYSETPSYLRWYHLVPSILSSDPFSHTVYPHQSYFYSAPLKANPVYVSRPLDDLFLCVKLSEEG